MKSAIGVYDTHDQAIDAVKQLKESGFPVSKLTIMGLLDTEGVDEQLHVAPKSPLKLGGLEAGTAIGTALGVLTGIGIFAVPGVGFLFGAGALVGALAGLDIGMVGGGLISALVTVGVKDDMAKKYHDALVAGKFIVVAHGTEAEVNVASVMLHDHGTHTDLQVH